MNIQPVELTGTRVKLVPMEASHAEALFEAGQDPRIWTYMSMKIETLDDMKRWVDQALEGQRKGVELPFVIVDQGKIVGSTRFLDISAAHRGLEIGFTWLSPEVWRTRINTECKFLLLRHAFETLKAIRVQLKTDERNVRSQTAIARLGAKKEGTLRNHRIMPDGHYRHSVYFSILDTEWPDVKEKLTAILESAPSQH